MIGGTGWVLIELESALDRLLSFQAGGYVNCVIGDIGKPVVGAVTTDSGVLKSYDNVARTWVVTMDDEGDLFDIIEAVSIFGGFGFGTTLGASTLNIDESFTFTRREERDIKVGMPKVLDTPDILLDNGDTKRFVKGYLPHILLRFYADDYVTTVSSLANSIQVFFKNMFNHHNTGGLILITPHLDKPAQKYYFHLETEWGDFENAFNRWLGYVGTLEFSGAKLIPSIDVMP